MRDKPANRDQVIAKIAAQRHGVISATQLAAAGLDRQGIHRRAKAGRLHRLHRGVYAVGHTRLSFEGRCMAAVLACGERAVVSHRSAAALWGLLSPAQGPIDVTVTGDGGRDKRVGITIHRLCTLAATSFTRRHGIPITTPARTLRDLHRTLPQPVYRRAVRRALDLRLISDKDLEREPDLTRSELERRFLALCRRHRLPQPEVNVRVAGYEVDFLWRDRSLIAETDGFRHHSTRASFESDRARDAELQRRGYRVLRFTHRQVVEEPVATARALRGFLAQSPLTPNL
jgi:very-short-patch-repair endonuclease